MLAEYFPILLFLAVGTGGAYAADKLVRTSDIRDRAVTSAKLDYRSVTASKIANGAVTTRTSWPLKTSHAAISPVYLPMPVGSGAKLMP